MRSLLCFLWIETEKGQTASVQLDTAYPTSLSQRFVILDYITVLLGIDSKVNSVIQEMRGMV